MIMFIGFQVFSGCNSLYFKKMIFVSFGSSSECEVIRTTIAKKITPNCPPY